MIPLPKESKAIFNPLFVKDAAHAIDKIVKRKFFMENYLNYLAQNPILGKN